MKYILFFVQLFTAVISLAKANVLLLLKPFRFNLQITLPSIQQVSTLILLGLSVFVVSSFRFIDSPRLDAFPLVVPTLSFGLEHERFDFIENVSFENAKTMRQFFKEVGVPAALRRLSIIDVRKQFGSERRSIQGARLFYKDNKLARVAVPIDHISYLRVDLESASIMIGDLEGIQSEFASTTIFFNGDVDSTLKYTLLDVELKNRIRLAFTRDVPLDTGFHQGVVQIVYTIKRDDIGTTVGFGDIEALRYRVNQDERTSIRFVDSNLEVEGFFNPDGSSIRKSWLSSPVPGARISSPFNLRRRHPILKRIKPHYGTDYAAPYGTPILAVSDGVIVANDRNRTNGKFIKIRHDENYQSQYLHLKGFARNVKPGAHVKKGQVIGYVGSTGLSSGPHVCFRFWKNGRQVDHRKEDLQNSGGLTNEAMAAFEKKQADLQALLDIKVYGSKPYLNDFFSP